MIIFFRDAASMSRLNKKYNHITVIFYLSTFIFHIIGQACRRDRCGTQIIGPANHMKTTKYKAHP